MASGCGRGPSLGTIPVRGRITYKKAPVPSGRIVLDPVDAEGGGSDLVRAASGAIQSDGRFVLSTFEHGDGVLPGTYAVRIIAMVDVELDAEPADQKTEWLVPEKYSSTRTSELTFEVPADARAPLEYKLDLTD